MKHTVLAVTALWFGLAVLMAPAGSAAEEAKASKSGFEVFYGECDRGRIAIYASGDGDDPGGALTFAFIPREDPAAILVYDLAAGETGVFAGLSNLAGGGYAYLRFRDGRRSYVVYSGATAEGERRAGMAVENPDFAYEHYNLDASFSSRMGPELFGALGVAADAAGFDLPIAYRREECTEYIADPSRTAALYRLAARRMAEITASRRKAVLMIEDSEESVATGPAVFFVLGEEKDGKLLPLERYAIDEAGEIYREDYFSGGEFVPAFTEPLPRQE